MLNTLVHFFKLPVYRDEEQNMKSRLLAITLFTAFTSSIIGLGTGFVMQSYNIPRLFLVMLAASIIVFFLFRAGKIRIASLTILFALLVPLVIYLPAADGTHDSMTGLFFVLILIASMLLDHRDYILYAAATFISIQILSFLEINKILDCVLCQYSIYLDMFAWGCITFAMIGLADLFSRITRRSLLQFKQSNLQLQKEIAIRKQAEAALRDYSENLEAMVAERTRELQEAQERLMRQERLATIGELAGSVGHELRNPLGVISNALYLLKMMAESLDEKTHEVLTIIEEAVDKSVKIISDLLNFARVRAVNREIIPMASIVKRTIGTLHIPDAVCVTIDVPEDLPPLYVDVPQIEQILSNLVTNAYQAMPDGGQLTVASAQTAMPGLDSGGGAPLTTRWIRTVVEDTGAGISPENMQKIFEPLFTTKSTGIGLGLPISKKLAEANGGSLQVESQTGKGTVFTLLLPVYEGES